MEIIMLKSKTYATEFNVKILQSTLGKCHVTSKTVN